LCLTLLLVSSAIAEEKKDEGKSKAVPLEKKLDKRGLLNLGYGYGINGLDLGYIGGGHYGGAYHAAPAHDYGQPIYLGHKTDVHKTITVLKGVPVPYEVRHVRCSIKYFNH
jgi:hypothetical protein